MSKAESILTDAEMRALISGSPFTLGLSVARLKDFICQVEKAVVAKLVAEPNPIGYLHANGISFLSARRTTIEQARSEDYTTPLYARSMPATDQGLFMLALETLESIGNEVIEEAGSEAWHLSCEARDAADRIRETQISYQESFGSSLTRSKQLDRALVKSLALQSGFKPKEDSELREYVYEFAEKLLGSYQGLADDSNHDIGSKEQHRTAKNHFPGAGKMIPPYGYRLVKLADIDTAIQRASVFDDGGDGADPESARSCIEILKGMISSKAADSLEPKKEVVHDRHTGKELLYIPPAGESLYSIAQARKESFSPALSVDIKEVQALLQSYLDSLDGWQLVPKEPSRDMLKKMFYEIFDMDGIEEEHLAARYRNMLSSFPKYTEVKQ